MYHKTTTRDNSAKLQEILSDNYEDIRFLLLKTPLPHPPWPKGWSFHTFIFSFTISTVARLGEGLGFYDGSHILLTAKKTYILSKKAGGWFYFGHNQSNNGSRKSHVTYWFRNCLAMSLKGTAWPDSLTYFHHMKLLGFGGNCINVCQNSLYAFSTRTNRQLLW